MSSWTTAETAESATLLLSISHGRHTNTMDHGGLVDDVVCVGLCPRWDSSSLAFSLQGVIAENLPGYAEAQKGWHLAPIMIAILVTTGLMNSYAFGIVPWLELASDVAHCLLFIVFVGVFADLGTGNSAEFVFTDSTSYSGWGKFVAFNIGMLVHAWGLIDFDGVNHMTEEVRRARHEVSRAMVYTILVNGTLALIVALVIMFQTGDITPYLESGYPIIPIFMAIAGTKAANALVSGRSTSRSTCPFPRRTRSTART
jgi:amino acid transporter